MKFVGIIFCVLLFCSKIVDSNPQSEGQIRQRAYQSSNWPVNKNVANEEYPDTDFAQSQNGDTLINQEPNENVRNYYPNQARYTNDFRYNKGPILSQRAEVLANDDSSEDGRILESYPSRVERYPLRTSQVRLDDQHKRNWQQPNQYVRSQVVISENERPLETVEEPYHPVQFVKPKYIPPVNQRFRQPDRSFVAREQYPITRNADDTEYVANPAPRYQSRGPVTYESFTEDQDTPVETRVRVNNQKYAQNPGIVSQSRITHNGPRENVGYVENDRFVNTAPISNYNDSPSGITVVENYDTDAVDLTPVNEEREIPVEVNKVPLQRPQIQRYPNNFRPNSHWSNVARHQTYNAVPVPTNYEGDLVSNNPAPINDNGAPSVPIIQRPVSSEDEDEPRTPYSDNANPDRNLYRQLTSGVQKYDLNKIVTNPQVKNILAANNKRFIVFHPNGTIENLDKVDLDSQTNSKFRLVHSTPKQSDVVTVVPKSEVVNETPAPPRAPTTIGKLPVRRLPPNLKPKVVDINTKSLPLPPPSTTSTPLPVEDTNLKVSSVIKPVGFPPQADESYSAPLPPSFEASPENDKIKIVPAFEPANDDNSKPKNTNEPEDEETSRPLPPNETQPLNDNTKPQPEEPVQPVNHHRFVRPYRPLPPYARRPILRPPFKPLPPYARNKFQPLFPRVEQPANDEKLNPVAENDDQPRENLPEVENLNPKIENPQSDIESKPLPDIDQPAGNGKPTILKPQEKVVVYDGSFQPLEDDLVPTTPSNDVTSTTLSPKEPENKLPKKPRRKLIRRPPTTTTPAPTPANPDKNPDDEIITISPIELITENVSDVPPTTPSPVKPPGPEDRKKDKNQSSTTPAPSKDDKGKTTTVSPITTTVATDDDDETETSKPTTESPGEDAKIVVSIDSQDDDEEAPQVFKTNCKTIQAYSDDEDGDIKIDLPKGKGKGDSAMWVKTTNQDFIDILTGNNDNDMDMIYVFNIDYRPIIEREKHTQIFPNGTVVVTTKETTYSGKNDSKPKVVTSTQTMQIEDYDSDED
ncbi:unnamed protein product [Spodoptera littoralis]|uniref:Uncharacterized protein n=1 Tax=Spodoptera littoralis TaxID=7109 RepID=A0A9P0N7D7_SPOLI|nr:unnamed protein product [Spodoptera littoralis]CAH1644150.1 unnamed protein product [Spodoptera littoralis]